MYYNNHRITPLGYTLMMIFILVSTILGAHLIRSISHSDELVYKLSSTLKLEKQSYELNFKMNTIGDAVIYEQKHIESHNLLHMESPFVYVKGQTNNVPYDAFITTDHLIAKPDSEMNYLKSDLNQLITLWNENYHFKLSDILKILQLTEEEKIIFYTYDLPKITNVLETYGEMNKNTFILSITLNEAFELLDEITHELSKNDEMVRMIANKYMRFYELFAHNPLLKDNALNSRRLFKTMVSLNDDFYGTCHDYILSLKKEYTQIYHGDSKIVITLDFDRKILDSIKCDATLRYKSCDAYEAINFSAVHMASLDLSLPKGPMDSLDDYLKKTLQSVHLSFK